MIYSTLSDKPNTTSRYRATKSCHWSTILPQKKGFNLRLGSKPFSTVYAPRELVFVFAKKVLGRGERAVGNSFLSIGDHFQTSLSYDARKNVKLDEKCRVKRHFYGCNCHRTREKKLACARTRELNSVPTQFWTRWTGHGRLWYGTKL